MKHAPDASSSDLERARELSRKLRGDASNRARAGAAAVPAPGKDGFLRFRAGGLLPAPAPSAPVSGTLWDPFLDWCLAVAGATAGFVLDGQGLLVAVRGALSAGDAEGIGARVMVALEQARKIQPGGSPDPAVSIDFGSGCLSGFAVALKDRSVLTIGLVGPRSVAPAARGTIASAFAARG